MSRAPPATSQKPTVVISSSPTSLFNSFDNSEQSSASSEPKLFNVAAKNSLEIFPEHSEKFVGHEDLHTEPIKFESANNSCLINTLESSSALFAKLKEAALSGDAIAQNRLGQCYLNGNGVDKNYSRAVSWLRKAARRENQEAQQSLVVAYKEGRGIKKDLTLATYWLLKSCANNKGQSVTINFHRDLIKHIAPVLAEFPEFRKIKKIEFHRMGLSGEGVAAVAQLIQFNPLIETLDLSGNDIDNDAALLLMHALEDNTNLRQLIIDADDIDTSILARLDALLSQKCSQT